MMERMRLEEKGTARSIAREPDADFLLRQKRRRRIAIGMMLTGLALTCPFFFSEWHSPYKMIFTLPGMLLTVGGEFLSSLVSDTVRYEVDAAAFLRLDSEFRRRAEAIAARLGLEPVATRVMTETTRGDYQVVLDRQGLGIAVRALENFRPEEIDFLVATHLAGRKRRHVEWSIAILALPMIALAVAGALFFSSPLMMFLCLAPLPAFIPFARWFLKRQVREADRLAVETTGDPRSAVSALEKLIGAEKAKSPRSALEGRRDAIRLWAEA